RMQAAIARDILQMIAGQHRDVRAAGTADVTAQSVEDSVASKSGEELALFAGLAAEFAGAHREAIDHYATMGRALGTAAPLASDCKDLFASSPSKVPAG